VRAAGYRTLYNPQSEVVHHEGRSHGRDTNSGIKAYQVTNQERLRGRWGDVLARDHFPNAHNVLEARDRSRNKIHVLVIDHYVPQWDQDAGSRTIYQYLEIFLDLGFQVTFWPDNLYRDPVYSPALQAMGIEVIYGPRFHDGFETFIRDRSELYDAVFVSRPHVADRYLSMLRKHSRARILYYGHDLHFRRMEASRQLGVSVEPQIIEDMHEMEMRVCRDCDVIFYPDPEEVKIIADEVESDRSVIANPVFVYDDTEIEAAKERLASILGKQGDRLLFVGGFNHSPNREGIAWFIQDVMPLVADRVPGVHLDVAGSNPPPDIVSLDSDRVTILGRVSDEKLFELYDECSVAVAPLRYGAGVKGKVIEAMALGVPVATTTTGAQGIEPSDQALFIGDTAEALAEEIVRALTDRDQAARRAERALDFIKHHYGRSAMSDLFRRLIVENASA
jgi:glycosyltransferase involved in cell wall biosynthesis